MARMSRCALTTQPGAAVQPHSLRALYAVTAVPAIAACPPLQWVLGSQVMKIRLPALRILIVMAFYFCALPGPAQTWTQTGAPADTWRSIACSANGIRLIAAGDEGICESLDGGLTWLFLNSTPSGSVACSADGTKIIASGSGAVYTSPDSGATWQQHGLTSDDQYYVASSAEGTNPVAAGFRWDFRLNLSVGQFRKRMDHAGRSGKFLDWQHLVRGCLFRRRHQIGDRGGSHGRKRFISSRPDLHFGRFRRNMDAIRRSEQCLVFSSVFGGRHEACDRGVCRCFADWRHWFDLSIGRFWSHLDQRQPIDQLLDVGCLFLRRNTFDRRESV